MASENIWESTYLKGQQLNLAPYSEVISFLVRQLGPDYKGKRVLEIGCGVGNNLLFTSWSLGCQVYGVEFSASAVKLALERFATAGLPVPDIRAGAVPPIEFPADYFDAVIDRAAMQHNLFEDVQKITTEVLRVLKPGGIFYSSFTSENHVKFGQGKNLGNGDFNNEAELGVRHFFSRAQVLELFKNFQMLNWYSTSRTEILENRLSGEVFHLELRK